jgi:hypothetical protein
LHRQQKQIASSEDMFVRFLGSEIQQHVSAYLLLGARKAQYLVSVTSFFYLVHQIISPVCIRVMKARIELWTVHGCRSCLLCKALFCHFPTHTHFKISNRQNGSFPSGFLKRQRVVLIDTSTTRLLEVRSNSVETNRSL